MLVYYPKLDGIPDNGVEEQINTELYSIFVNSRRRISAEDLLTVDDSFSAKLMKNLLVIERTGYDYNIGAAHGMPIRDYIFIDTVSGAFYQLEDLFPEGSDFAAAINTLISEEIKADIAAGDSMYTENSFAGITESQYFRLEEDALIIYFYPYDIAAYAAGFPEFTIPFEDIDGLINKDGNFWKSFRY